MLPARSSAARRRCQLVRRRHRLVQRYAVAEHPHAVPPLDDQAVPGQPAGQVVDGVGAGGHAELVDVAGRVERLQRPRPLPPHRVPQRHRLAVAGDQRQHAARRGRRGQPGQRGARVVEVHQHAVAQHQVVRRQAGRRRLTRQVAYVTDLQGDLTTYRWRLCLERGAERRQHVLGDVDRGDPVPLAGQPQRLGALAGADVEHRERTVRAVAEQVAPGRVELDGDEVLAHDVAQVAEPGEPQLAARLEAGGRVGRRGGAGHPRARRRPERSRGGGSRNRRICMLRIRA